jgi:DNA-binding NarL/FixJ family response regulator
VFQITYSTCRECNGELGYAALESSLVSVLVVEDFIPFRSFICSTLARRVNLHVICEVSDGLEAVQKTKELRPDLIFLDIGLPTLNGISVAREICKFSKSKIIFVTQESDPHFVQEALALGAWGYVVKARASNDLLAAVDAVCDGRKFVSNGFGSKAHYSNSDGKSN